MSLRHEAEAPYSIRDLAATFGVTARALRFYEAKGLLNPLRRGGARYYSARDHARLDLILRGKRVGFSLDEIKEMLDVDALGSGGRSAAAGAAERFRQRIAALEVQRADIALALRDLRAGLAWLEKRANDEAPDDELRARAAAFEALSRAWLYGGESAAAE